MAKLLCLKTSWERLVLGVVAALMLGGDADNNGKSVKSADGISVCQGSNEEYDTCPRLKECPDNVPVDCSFSDWEDWYHLSGCVGLCFRQRSIKQQNNEHGKPCNGTKVESKACKDPGCGGAEKDCEFGDWQDWSNCVAKVDQRVRTRQIVKLAGSEGNPCNGSVKETMPCAAPEQPVDCLLSDWGSWADCSDLCGGGHKTRARRVYRHAAHGGKPCKGQISQMSPCSTQACIGVKDCKVTDWTEWTRCDKKEPQQRFRSRDVKRKSTGGGRACTKTLRETEPCPVGAHSHGDQCMLSDWSTWTHCTASCDGGQTYRHRHPALSVSNSVLCFGNGTKETRGCNMDECPKPLNDTGTDCELASWSSWSSCSEDCGPGKRERTRRIVEEASHGGLACAGPTKEVIGCIGVRGFYCAPVDCVWGDWEMWEACTATCGSGLQRRSRSIKKSPLRGGRLCDAIPKTEVMSCARAPCHQCVDGTWSVWSQWSECSMTCGHGVRSRQRTIAQPPSQCGSAPTGRDTEVQVCTGARACVADRDCQFEAWSSWSSCCPDCFGVRKRHRQIETYATGDGASCSDRVAEVKPCNPGDGEPVPATCKHIRKPRPCELSSWSEWTRCTVTCSGGQSSRQRNIVGWPSKDGKTCQAPLFETRACSTKSCIPERCVDCLWGPWSDWGHCARCGGQRERKRSIAQMPNHCGTRCEMRSAQETSNCSSACGHGQFCTWATWTAFAGCPTDGCGPHTQRRHRWLHYVDTPGIEGYIFEGSGKLQCSGAESEMTSCPFRPCVLPCEPEPCLFATWSDWAVAGCDGLCERQRVVKRNSKCGAPPCSGALAETKQCKPHCNLPVDCKLSPWSHWTGCQSAHGQTYRTRTVARPTLNGGRTCDANLQETLPCDDSRDEVVACSVTDWSDWGDCKKTCGDSWQVRTRFIHTPAAGGGQPCRDNLEEVRGCNDGACIQEGIVQDCVFADWGEWGHCRADGQMVRERKIQEHSDNGGKACRGALSELRPCSPVDCRLSDWSPWDKCPTTCGGGQQQRHRQVNRRHRHGGLPCPSMTSLKELRACGEAPCNPHKDCTVSQWSRWGPCSHTCGVGQQRRMRAVNQTRHEDGLGCFMSVVQTRMCATQKACPATDCQWGTWTSWSTCSLTCGGGQQLRTRAIKVMPRPGGRPCRPLPKEEVQACGLTKCKAANCVDSEWGSWSEWGHCSTSCQGGVAWRSRKISQEANICGKQATGSSRQYRGCNMNVTCRDADCVMGSWEDWSGCTAICNGIKRRSRYVKVFGFGKGTHCNAALKETAPCHPSEGERTPQRCQSNTRRDCEFSDWEDGTCSATCGGGHVQRLRHIKVEQSGDGASCSGALKMELPCSTQACPHTTSKCHWSDWSDWGACDRCGGERKRNRHIEQAPSSGGVCEPGDSEEVSNCTRTCGEKAGMSCTWASWSAWSPCSATCGDGRRQRRRDLVLKAGGALLGTEHSMSLAEQHRELQKWELQNRRLEQKHMQDLAVVAITSSCTVAGIAAMLLWRFSSSRSQWRSYSDGTKVATHSGGDRLGLLSGPDESE